jgi:flavin reductase (DIM6/NTAB) family NADH-FMN oxidoreductase RutF
MRSPVDLKHASRLLNHGPTVLVGTRHGSRRDVMAAAWSMPVEFTPPRLAVVIDKSTRTAELVAASGVLAISVPCRSQADLTFTVGSVGGRDLEREGTDKFERYGIVTFEGPVLGLPLIDGCVAWMECRVIEAPDDAGTDRNLHARVAYDTIFVEVVSAQADARVFSDGRWRFADDNAELHTLHHLGGGEFAVPAEVVRGRMIEP